MAKPDKTRIRFSCPHCHSPLQASQCLKDKSLRCPQCQAQVKVPREKSGQSSSKKADEYGFTKEGDYSTSDTSPASSLITFDCVVCGSRLFAPAALIGQKVVCPDCEVPCLVPPESEKRATKEPLQVQIGKDEEYGVNEATNLSTPPVEKSQPVTICMNCPICNTWMRATLDQVGQKVTCPDCDTPMTVPPPTKKPKRKPWEATTVDGADQYDLNESTEVSVGDSPTIYDAYIKARCPRCDTRQHVKPEQVGQQIECFDCHETYIVEQPKEPSRRIDPREFIEGEYAMGAAAERAHYEPEFDLSHKPVRWDDEAERERTRSVRTVEEAQGPRKSYFADIFGFLFYPTTWPGWVRLSLGLIPGFFILLVAIALWNVTGAGGMGIAPLFIASSVFFLIVWSLPASSYTLTILQETAAGGDQVESWPDLNILDHTYELFFMLMSFVYAAIPGFMMVLFFKNFGGWVYLTLSVGGFLLFPIVLLATMETGSAMKPLSGPIWRSCFICAVDWLIFYTMVGLLTVVLLIAVIPLARTIGAFAAPLLAPILVAYLFLYMRLLGRLAWICRQKVDIEEKVEVEKTAKSGESHRSQVEADEDLPSFWK